MLSALKSHALSVLILSLGSAGSAFACGLNHCARPRPAAQDGPTLGWTVEHTDLTGGDPRNAFSQGSLQGRYPLGARWSLGGRLPLGYLRKGASGQWGLGNPLAYAEWSARPAPSQALALGLQGELPFGDAVSGIASDHAMVMPYASYAMRGLRGLLNASLGLAVQVPDGHEHGHGEVGGAGAHHHALHSAWAADSDPPDPGQAPSDPAGDFRVEANPHEPYEVLYRLGLGFPLERSRLEPEVALSGARVLFAEPGDPVHFVGIEAAVGLRLARTLLLKPRWEKSLTRPGRFTWRTGLDFKVELPAR